MKVEGIRFDKKCKGMLIAAGAIFALAQPSFAASDVDSKFLAHLEAIQKFCAKVSPEARPETRPTHSLATAVNTQVPDEQLQTLRDSDGYRQVFAAVTAELEKGEPKRVAREACGEAPETR